MVRAFSFIVLLLTPARLQFAMLRILPSTHGLLEHRAEPEVRVSDPKGHASEKWTRLFASAALRVVFNNAML
ncbi:hypothetical protein DC522_08560 [Microvirga sp. KLBC 81]|nr:hypothetical protein DC522_08560 [Microvirga sp. KLBC 81]